MSTELDCQTWPKVLQIQILVAAKMENAVFKSILLYSIRFKPNISVATMNGTRFTALKCIFFKKISYILSMFEWKIILVNIMLLPCCSYFSQMANVQHSVSVALSTAILLVIWHDTSEEVVELNKKSSLPEFNRSSDRLIMNGRSSGPIFWGEDLAKS